MKYNFQVKVALEPEDNETLSDEAIGLAVETTIVVRVQVDAKTELPENLLDELKDKVTELLTEKLGQDVDAELVGLEY